MASYFDYEAMEYTPEISVALDIFADEATTANESGKILSVYSESTRIKNELTNLFENVLDINTNLTSWARNLVKYGDNFVYTKIVPKKGVVGIAHAGWMGTIRGMAKAAIEKMKSQYGCKPGNILAAIGPSMPYSSPRTPPN